MEIKILTEKEVRYKVKCIDDAEWDTTVGKIYDCYFEVYTKEGKLLMIGIRDDANDNHYVAPEFFEKLDSSTRNFDTKTINKEMVLVKKKVNYRVRCLKKDNNEFLNLTYRKIYNCVAEYFYSDGKYYYSEIIDDKGDKHSVYPEEIRKMFIKRK